MSSINLSADDLATAEALGMTAEEFVKRTAGQKLTKGAYKGLVAKAEIRVVNKPGKPSDGALQLSMQIWPTTKDGLQVKRFGTKWVNLNLPIKHGSFVPSDGAMSYGLDQLRYLSESTKISVATIVNAAKEKNVATGLMGANIVFGYDSKPSDTDPSQYFDDVKFVRASSKLNPLDADKASGGGASAGTASTADISF